MNENDINEGMSGFIDFIAMFWNNILLPVLKGIGALIEMLPPVAVGIIACILIVVYLFRRARRG